MNVLCSVFLFLIIVLFIMFMSEIVLPVSDIILSAKRFGKDVRFYDGRIFVKEESVLGMSEYGHIRIGQHTLRAAYYDALNNMKEINI